MMMSSFSDRQKSPAILFLHGLDSSSNGFKARYFSRHFPEMIAPDFSGNLTERLHTLEKICRHENNLVLIGSSFGGLMATCFATIHPDKVVKLVLLAPALNFPEFTPPASKIKAPALLVIGDSDVVTPPDQVIPLARQSFENLHISCFQDDHLLKKTFTSLNWTELINGVV